MKQKNKKLPALALRLGSVGLAVIAAAYISAAHFRLMLIQGSSMEPSYHNFQLVVLDRHSRSCHRGDVIAFRCRGLSAVLVKRVAAEEGDRVQICEGTLLVNGEPSPLYAEGSFEYGGILESPVVLGGGEYIVIGDNISESKDSRYEAVGIVRAEDIIGRVI